MDNRWSETFRPFTRWRKGYPSWIRSICQLHFIEQRHIFDSPKGEDEKVSFRRQESGAFSVRPDESCLLFGHGTGMEKTLDGPDYSSALLIWNVENVMTAPLCLDKKIQDI